MALTQTLSRQIEAAPDTLALEIGDAQVMRAAQHLIVRHRQGQRFDIEALDVPHEALASISAQLEEAGMSHALSEPFVEALRRYIMANGGSFARAANAKPVRISMVVADRMPKARFDQAVTELACLGARETKVEGATRVNVRATPSGTATSSNAADVDAMFANVRGLYLWVRFEAPTKAELDGLMTAVEAAMAGVAQSVGGAMGAGELKKLLDTLQKDGVLTPAIAAVINTLVKIQEGMGKDGKPALPPAALDALIKELGTQIEKAQAQGLMPEALMTAVMASVAEMASDQPALAAFVVENGFADLIADNDNQSAEQRLETLMEQIAALQAMDGLDPALAAQLAAMVEAAKADMAAGDVNAAAVLETLGEKLGEMAERGDIPAALAQGIEAILPEQQQAAIDLAQGEALLAVLEDIAAKIEKGEIDINDVPPELRALIEIMGGTEILLQQEGREARIETLAAAVAGQGDPALAEMTHAAIVVMANPEAMAAFPPETIQAIQNFVADHPQIVEAAAVTVANRAAVEVADVVAGEPQKPTVKPEAVPIAPPQARTTVLETITPSGGGNNGAYKPPPAPVQDSGPPKPVGDAPSHNPPPVNPVEPAKPAEAQKSAEQKAPPPKPAEINTSIAAIIAQVKPEKGSGLAPTQIKAVVSLLEQTQKLLSKHEGKGPLPDKDVKQILQTLVDAKTKIDDPKIIKEIDNQIKSVQQLGKNPERPVTPPEPTRKPGCAPLCKCHDTDAIKDKLEKNTKITVEGEKVTLADGRVTTVAEIAKDNIANEAAIKGLAEFVSGKPAEATDFKPIDCPCDKDHRGGDGGHSNRFNDMAKPATINMAVGVKITTHVGPINVETLKQSAITAKLTNSFK